MPPGRCAPAPSTIRPVFSALRLWPTVVTPLRCPLPPLNSPLHPPIRDLITACWSADPDKRPAMREVMARRGGRGGGGLGARDHGAAPLGAWWDQSGA